MSTVPDFTVVDLGTAEPQDSAPPSPEVFVVRLPVTVLLMIVMAPRPL